jgi:hypothetical protein
VAEARIEGLTFKDSLDESESSISKSEGIMVYDWKNGRIKQDRTKRGLIASQATPIGFLYTTIGLGVSHAGL